MRERVSTLLSSAPRLVWWLVASMAIASAGCGAEPTAEEKIRALIDRVERAAEERDAGDVLDALADDFEGVRGEDRRDVERIVRGTFLRMKDVYVYTVIRSIDVTSQGEAEGTILVGMAGNDIDSPSQLRDLHADLYEFDLDFVEQDGEWKVSGGQWRPARLEHFF
jgi:uncharacterized protein (UPF0335 family)